MPPLLTNCISPLLLPAPIPSPHNDFPFEPPPDLSLPSPTLSDSSGPPSPSLSPSPTPDSLLVPEPPGSPAFLPHHHNCQTVIRRPPSKRAQVFALRAVSPPTSTSISIVRRLSATHSLAVSAFFDKTADSSPTRDSTHLHPRPRPDRLSVRDRTFSSRSRSQSRSASFARSPLAVLSAFTAAAGVSRTERGRHSTAAATDSAASPGSYLPDHPWRLLPSGGAEGTGSVNDHPSNDPYNNNNNNKNSSGTSNSSTALIPSVGLSPIHRGYHHSAFWALRRLVQQQALAAVSASADAVWRALLVSNYNRRLFSRFADSLQRVLMSLVSRFTFWLPPSPDLDGLDSASPPLPQPQRTSLCGLDYRSSWSLADSPPASASLPSSSPRSDGSGDKSPLPLSPSRSQSSHCSSTSPSSPSHGRRYLSAQLRPFVLPDTTVVDPFDNKSSTPSTTTTTRTTTSTLAQPPPSHLYFHLPPPPLGLSPLNTTSGLHPDPQSTRPRYLPIQSPLESVFSLSTGIAAPPGFAVLDIDSNSESESESEREDTTILYPLRSAISHRQEFKTQQPRKEPKHRPPPLARLNTQNPENHQSGLNFNSNNNNNTNNNTKYSFIPSTPVLQFQGHVNRPPPFYQSCSITRATPEPGSSRRRVSRRVPFPVAVSGSTQTPSRTASAHRHPSTSTSKTASSARPTSLLPFDTPMMSRRPRPATIYFQPNSASTPTPTPAPAPTEGPSGLISRRNTSLSASSEGTSASSGTRPSSSCATSVGQAEIFPFPSTKPNLRSPNRMSLPIPPSPMVQPHGHTQSPSLGAVGGAGAGGPPPASFLTLLAAQERKVLELREQLEKAEAQLATLKRTWANEAAKQKRIDRSRAQHGLPVASDSNMLGGGIEAAVAAKLHTAMPHQHQHRPAPTVSGLYDIGSETPQDRVNRRHSMMSAPGTQSRPYHRKVMSGSHPRPLSLLTESPIPLRLFPIADDTPVKAEQLERSEQEERMDALAALEGRPPVRKIAPETETERTEAIESPSILAASSAGLGFSSARAVTAQHDQQVPEPGMRRRPSSVSSHSHHLGGGVLSPRGPPFGTTTTTTTTAGAGLGLTSPPSYIPALPAHMNAQTMDQPRGRNPSSSSASMPLASSASASASASGDHSASLMTTARGVRDSLWTLFEDLKQVVSAEPSTRYHDPGAGGAAPTTGGAHAPLLSSTTPLSATSNKSSIQRSQSVYLPSHSHSFSLSHVGRAAAPPRRSSGRERERERERVASRSRGRPSPSLTRLETCPPSRSNSKSNVVTAASLMGDGHASLITTTVQDRRRSVYAPSAYVSPTVCSKVYDETSGEIDEWETWGVGVGGAANSHSHSHSHSRSSSASASASASNLGTAPRAVSSPPRENKPILGRAWERRQGEYGTLVGSGGGPAGGGYGTNGDAGGARDENGPRRQTSGLGVLFEEEWR